MSAEIRPHYRTVKSVLRKHRQVDPFFVGKYAFSPYQACAHGCPYCDGRAEKYWIEGEFDRDIVIRQNAAAVLEAEVKKLRERGIVFIGSGVSDAYQPSEAQEQLMPACGRILARHALPVTILTKSSLITRDLDLWCEVNEKAGFVLMVSLMTLDDRLRAVFEPQASPVEERLETLRAFKARGCAVGVAAMPFLPFLSDGEAEQTALATRLAEIGVDFVLPGGLTLRPGRQKEAYFAALRSFAPELLPKYERLYGEDRPSGAPLRAPSAARQRQAESVFARAGFPLVVPHRIYRDRLPLYDELDVLLHQMQMHYARTGDALRRLEEARQRYHAWLLSRREAIQRMRRHTEQCLTAELRALAASDGWPRLLGNEKLAGFLREVVLDRRIFDEQTRRLA